MPTLRSTCKNAEDERTETILFQSNGKKTDMYKMLCNSFCMAQRKRSNTHMESAHANLKAKRRGGNL